LKEKDVTATFFLISQAAEQNALALKALIAAGTPFYFGCLRYKRMLQVKHPKLKNILSLNIKAW